MNLTPKQQEVINLWKQAGARFLGFYESDADTVTVALTDKAQDSPGDRTGEVFRIKYNKDGTEAASAYYPHVLTPNPHTLLWK